MELSRFAVVFGVRAPIYCDVVVRGGKSLTCSSISICILIEYHSFVEVTRPINKDIP
jgi:hypothetical protein